MRNSGGRRVALITLLVAAPLLLRLAAWLELRDEPFFNLLVVDARTYDETAREMAAGTWRMTTPYWQPPLYPLFLSGIYRVQADPNAARLVQALLGSLVAWLAFRLGERLAGRRVAWIAWALTAACGPLIFFDLQLLGASLATFLGLLAFDRLLGWGERARRRDLVAAGVLLGLASITVATALVLIPVFVLWVWRCRRESAAAGPTRGRTRRSLPSGAGAAATLLLCALLPVLTVTVRNYAASRQLVLISYNGGVNFWIGNNRDYDRAVAIRPGRAWQALTAEPIEAGAKTEAETSSWFFRQAVRWIGGHPFEWLGLLGRKTYLFLRGDELSRNQEIYPFRSSSIVLRSLLWTGGLAFPSGLLIPLGLAGLWGRLRRPRGRSDDRAAGTSGRTRGGDEVRGTGGLLALGVGAYALGVIAFFIASRYRVPLLPVFAVFSAAFLVQMWDGFRSGRRRELLLPGAIAGFLLIVSNAGAPAMPRGFHSDTYSDMGTFEFAAGRYDPAEAWYQKALELDANNAEAAHNLGAIQLKRGRPESAEPLFRRVLATWPQDERALINLGNCYLQRGEPYRAGRYFLEAFRHHPQSVDAAATLSAADAMAAGLERERMAADPEGYLALLDRLQAHEPENEYLRRRLRELRSPRPRTEP